MTMLTSNPTTLTLGKTGTLAGQTWRVIGRVVVGMEDAGEFYSWQEFNLASLDERENATLVYEENEEGDAAWKLFVYFTPDQPLTAAEAADYRVGQSYSVNGRSAEVTLVDESRVYHIEGIAPEGVQVGDIAHYFNAETADDMIVVSWTGDEVEYFHGTELETETVERAFQLSPSPARPSNASYTSGDTSVSKAAKLIVLGSALIIGVAVLTQIVSRPSKRSYPPSTSSPAPKYTAPTPPSLNIGTNGLLGRTQYLIVGRSIGEHATPAGKHLRYDYHLVAADGATAILTCALETTGRTWLLLTPVTLAAPLSPQQAARFQTEQPLPAVAGHPIVKKLYRLTSLETSGTVPEFVALNQPLYHLVAKSASEEFHLGWNSAQLKAFRATALTEQAVTLAFASVE